MCYGHDEVVMGSFVFRRSPGSISVSKLCHQDNVCDTSSRYETVTLILHNLSNPRRAVRFRIYLGSNCKKIIETTDSFPPFTDSEKDF